MTIAQPTLEMNVFYAADTLGMPLHQVENRIRGTQEKVVHLGNWTVKPELIVVSDVVSKECASFFVRFHKALWGYLVVEGGSSYILIFDGDELKMKPHDAVSFCTGTVEKTVAKIAKAIKATFVFNGEEWTKFDANPDPKVVGMDA